jgi:two-component system nitrogen regulation response regulator GlnG/two-component system response regulator HydG
LRERIAFVGPREPHVLVLGESGVGKELAARALHALSPRGKWPLITRSAATLPPERVDIELFGNARNYPNPGLAERPGLLGAAHRSTLFLDDIGEMPPPFQDHLLRVLDAGGEYQRLGDAAVRTADVRIIAATSRPLFELRRDLRARLALTVEIPGFAERREDIPLLSRHLLRRMAVREDEALGERFFEGWDGTTGEPRVTPALVSMLLRHRFTHHARELQGLLWRAVVGSSDKRYVDRTKAMEEEMCVEPGPVRSER